MTADPMPRRRTPERVPTTRRATRRSGAVPNHQRFAAMFVAVAVLSIASSASAAVRRLVVPTALPSIQAAVDAAQSGDEIKVLAGTYREQVSIDKDLSIVGSGAGSTIIRAPGTLAPGEDGNRSIIEIRDGASVEVSRLTVSGPGSGTCENGVA